MINPTSNHWRLAVSKIAGGVNRALLYLKKTCLYVINLSVQHKGTNTDNYSNLGV